MITLIPLNFLPVHVFYVSNKKSWKKEMKALDVDEPWPSTAGRCTFIGKKDKEARIYITIPKYKKHSKEQVAGLVAHEATHAADFIFQEIGETFPSAEFRAYLTQYITQGVLEEMYNR